MSSGPGASLLPRRVCCRFPWPTGMSATQDNEQPNPAAVGLDGMRKTVTEGVHAFMRAYGARRGSVLSFDGHQMVRPMS